MGNTLLYAFDASTDLEKLLELAKPAFHPGDPFRQLNYIRSYVATLGGKSMALELECIDRHHVEDHSVYYSKSLRSYSNTCRRLHFFNLAETELKVAMETVLEKAQAGAALYRAACEQFSSEHYLGFSVIKPMHGAPVGRTVLRAKEGKHSHFPGLLPTRVHLKGLELTVSGIPFQQQDYGVSACATTAIWASLHYLRGSENLRSPTPVQITRLATQSQLPNGRAIPSEGLSLEQMCSSMQSLGIAPCLVAAKERYVSLAVIHAALRSRMVPILVMQRNGVHHAVAVTGSRISPALELVPKFGIAEDASSLEGLHLHDDRRGPYLLAPVDHTKSALILQIHGVDESNQVFEEWTVTHILIPTYPKIHLSFLELRVIGGMASDALRAMVAKRLGKPRDDVTALLAIQFLRGPVYVESLIHGPYRLANQSQLDRFLDHVVLPRYVGVVSLTTELTGRIDLLLDSTETQHNSRCLAVVSHSSGGLRGAVAAKFLHQELRANHLSVPAEDSPLTT